MRAADPFEAIVHRTVERLPPWARDALDNVQILIADEADSELHPDGGEHLLGLYVGVPLRERSIDDVGEMPDVIYVFRRPHLALGLTGHDLELEIAKTLIHEIGHYFGLDDDRLHELGWG